MTMEIFKTYQVSGDSVELKATNAKRFGFNPAMRGKTEAPGFAGEMGKTFQDQLSQVNDMQLTKDDMLQKLAVSPDEVNIDQVMIASEKARIALEFTKVIRDKLLTAYQTLINVR
jgi:flagellar hook-basal body complex protein FliE